MSKTALRALAVFLAAALPLSLAPLASADDDDDDGASAPSYWNNAGPVDPDDPVVVYSDQPTAEVDYEVTGSSQSADLFFGVAGGTLRHQGYVLPFHRKEVAWPPVQFMPMFATIPAINHWITSPNGNSRRPGDNTLTGGSATCRIWVSGKLVQERSASGVNHTAKCAVTVRFFQ